MAPLHAWLTPTILIWLFPVVFLIHDGEEILTVERWGKAHLPALRARFGRRPLVGAVISRAADTNTARFTTTVACLLVAILVASYLGTVGQPLWFAAALAVFFVNVFTHAGQSVIYGGYTPGVITAVLVALPYSLYTYARLFAAGTLTWPLVWRSIPVGLVGVVLVFISGWLLGRILFPTRTATKRPPT